MAKSHGVGVTACTFLLTLPVGADVTEYSVGRIAGYSQASSAQPTSTERWMLLATVSVNIPSEVIMGTFSFVRPPAVSFPLTEANPALYQYLSPPYTNHATFMLDYPVTTYTLTVDRAVGRIESGDLFLPESRYPLDVPYLTGDTFDRVQAYDPVSSFDGTINGFEPAASMDVFSTSLVVSEVGRPGAVWSAEIPSTTTAFQIPADALEPQRNYSLEITYFNANVTPAAGFGIAPSSAAFYRSTRVHFRTLGLCAGCPVDLNCDGVVDFGDYLEFLNLFDLQDPRVDFNQDGVVDFADYLEFLNMFDAGC